MTTQHVRAESADQLQQPSQGFDDIAASISALEKAMLEPPARDREAIHELGCRIVAQALKRK